MHTKWRKPLRNAIGSIINYDAEEWDPVAQNIRIKGQLGEYVRIYDRSYQNLFVCIDISEPINYYEDYAKVFEFFDHRRGGIRNRFKKIHLNYWAKGSFTPAPIFIKKTIRAMGLYEKTEECLEKAILSVETSSAFATSIFNPFMIGNKWHKLKPELIIVLTKARFINDIEQQYRIRLKKYIKKVVWICVDDVDGNYLSTILDIDSKAQERILLVK